MEHAELPKNVEPPTEDGLVRPGPNKRDYRIVCTKLGLTMCVFFVCRFLAGEFSWLISRTLANAGQNLAFILQFTVIIILIYVVPLIFAFVIFNSRIFYKGKLANLYKKPKRHARALGTFPAMFGLGHGTALLTLLAAFLISRVTGGETVIEDLLQPTTLEPAANVVYIIAIVFMLVVVAPVFEEFLTRGIMYDALAPFGAGVAIIITAILFGLMHGSLYMLFYTTAYGLALGYVRYATNSLYVVTILHAIVNGIGATALVLTSLMVMTNEENRVINTLYSIYLVVVLVAVIVGVSVFLSKIRSMRKYRIENPWTEIGPWKKMGIFFSSAPVIIMLVLAVNEISMGRLLGLVIGG
ncbi:MAG: CPBP family intramembrane metalloprotease [Oscillospiraceae bacterium]|nr:CPBP family intramembrane metalloprotease [Oscillospiraceae bacterium]MCL2278441.1 CPBP family intramembrane metalloprotease [Oscillospiraceae bacterium]